MCCGNTIAMRCACPEAELSALISGIGALSPSVSRAGSDLLPSKHLFNGVFAATVNIMFVHY